MFQNDQLKNHLETSSVIKSQAAVIAEWNMNLLDNIFTIGNYRYRPLDLPGSIYSNPVASFDEFDDGNYYTGATDSDIVVDGGFKNSDIPEAFQSKKIKEELLFSLEECFGKFRPRSGINKLRFFEGRYSHHVNESMTLRPRYYMPDKDDRFKYWTSYRTEAIDANDDGESDTTVERGISFSSGGQFYIDDTAPFVVYKEQVPANRIVLKMQTNVGSVDLGPFQDLAGQFLDPMFGDANKTTPSRWKVQYLKENVWVDAIGFDENSLREDGSPIVGTDGYFQINYGILVPAPYKQIFFEAGTFSSAALLPTNSVNGAAYLVKENDSSVGQYYVWINGEYAQPFVPEYGWYVANEDSFLQNSLIKDLTNHNKFVSEESNEVIYREFQYIKGIRVVVETMNKNNATFDLIEMSPRLAIDFSDKVTSFSLEKMASDLGTTGMPVGQLLASVGSLELFDYDLAFSKNNVNSIIANHLTQYVQFKFYEAILDVNGESYYVPVKTMYSEGFPELDSNSRTLSIALRDLFFYFESTRAPQLLIPDASLSYIISTLLDSIGFSNYTFKRINGEVDPIIPYFFVPPDISVAEVLNSLAVATQYAMFFDEYNNFVIMSKNYFLPSEGQREVDLTLRGTKDFADSGILENEKTQEQLSNILEISSQNTDIYNDGQISYTSRYIQRSYGTLRQASLLDKDKIWIYKPALLWEVAGEKSVRSSNDETSQQSAYALTAIPLKTRLSLDVPSVVNHQIVNNIIDFGEGVYWLPRYNGYLYANGEIIRYDAVEYAISGELVNNVWITSLQEYQNYFSKMSFNGKLYPTGRVRIYSEPNYEIASGVSRLANGSVVKHGRGQFGTKVVEHDAGISEYWTGSQSIGGCVMKSRYLFAKPKTILITGVSGTAGTNTLTMQDTSMVRPRYLVTLNSGTGALSKVGKTFVTQIINATTVQISRNIDTSLSNASIEFTEVISAASGVAGKNEGTSFASNISRTSIIKNFLSADQPQETVLKNLKEIQNGTIQSSALVMSGPESTTGLDSIAYVYKPLTEKFKHFGTRMRIVGSLNQGIDSTQSPFGAITYYEANVADPDKKSAVSGSSGGIGVLLNPETNNGYYFEIIAINQNGFETYADNEGVHNLVFYKVGQDASYTYQLSTQQSAQYNSGSKTLVSSANGKFIVSSTWGAVGERVLVSNQSASESNGYYVITDRGSDSSPWTLTKDDKAMPVKLWGGLSQILVDDGKFTGQGRMNAEASSTVYDVAVEYEDIGSIRRFYLYLNNLLLAVVEDTEPLPIYNNMALFIRGSAKCMFENIYAVGANYANTITTETSTPISNEIFGIGGLTLYEAVNKYAISGLVQATYLSGISTIDSPKYNIYYDEFGTIMREAAYFKVRYDKAYPALHAKLSPTFNRLKGYTVSGFLPDAYGAEFLIFNNTDTVLNLDETSGNYLRIQGVTFTQQSQNELTVDDFFAKKSDMSNPLIIGDSLIYNPEIVKEQYRDIKLSRLTYGKKEFSLDSPYIQSQDAANEMMSWLISKITKPRLSVGAKVFGLPIMQLGDIVNVSYSEPSVGNIVPSESKFVVYHITYTRTEAGPEMIAYLSEVV
jgi:hypothetical protein